jgi:hypothetical protein
MDRTDYDEEDEVDSTTCCRRRRPSSISPSIAPCTPCYQEESSDTKLEIIVRPRQSPMFSPTQLINIDELTDEEIELKCLIRPSSTPEGQKKPKRKSVRFNKRVRIQKIRHINDFSQQRVDDIWFTKSEYENMKAETLATLGLMLAEKPLGNHLTAKGLEYILPAASEQRQKDKHTHLHSILDEQDQQWASDIYDAQRIADISRTLTTEHRAAARTRGLLIVQDTVTSASKTRKTKSSKMSSSVRKSLSRSHHSRRELLKDIKSKTHSEHDRRTAGLQMTLLRPAAA